MSKLTLSDIQNDKQYLYSGTTQNINKWLNKRKDIDTSMLSEKQQFAFDRYLDGDNIFITGPGGCGKTKLIKLIVDHAKLNKKRVKVCAMTGCAAVLLECGAKTFHSWAGFGLANEDEERIIEKIMNSPMKKKNWYTTDILIIDEVSMMSNKLFNIFYTVSKKVRKSIKVFGGIQVIFSGDFYQLPPIDDDFCFTSDYWHGCFHEQIILDKIFRQDDPIWVKILNQIRQGYMTKKSFNRIHEQLDRKLPLDYTPTSIMPRRFSVDQINTRELKKIDKPIVKFKIKGIDIDSLSDKDKKMAGSFSEQQKRVEYDNLKSNMVCLEELELKIGAQVLCICNLDMDNENQICNGSQGIVIDFKEDGPLVKFNNGEVRTIEYHSWKSETIPDIGIQQIPLILSWAITIHRAQGITLEMAELDIGDNIFEKGQTYVALSRIKSIDGVYLTHFNPSKIQIDTRVKDFYERIKN